jgi:hypothetical protein
MSNTLSIFMIAAIAQTIIRDAMEVIHPKELQEAIEGYRELNASSTDEAQRAVAEDFDAAFDWDEALDKLGIIGDSAADFIEHIDGDLWYWAIKFRVKNYSRKRSRMLRKFFRRFKERVGANIKDGSFLDRLFTD